MWEPCRSRRPMWSAAAQLFLWPALKWLTEGPPLCAPLRGALPPAMGSGKRRSPAPHAARRKRSWRRRATRVVPVDQIALPHVLSSAAIPFLLPPVEVDGHLHCDGSLRMPVPLSPTLFGADIDRLRLAIKEGMTTK